MQAAAAALGAGPPGAVTAAVAAGRRGFVIVGHRAARGGAVTAAAWYAPGLAGWRAAAIAERKAGHGQTLMSAVTATARGFAAVGAAGTRPAAWLSADGRTWRQVGACRARRRGAGGARVRRGARRRRGGGGHRVLRRGSGSPFAEVSADSGATWTLVRLPGQAGGRAAAVTALTAAGGGFTAAGTYGTEAGSAVVVWTLPAAERHRMDDGDTAGHRPGRRRARRRTRSPRSPPTAPP